MEQSNKRSPRSKTWKHFTLRDGQTKVRCEICFQELAYAGNTSCMVRHLRAKHSNSSASGILSPERTGPIPSGKQREVDEALMNMIINDSQPFSIVEEEGFRSFVSKLDSSYIIPTSKALKNIVHEKYLVAKRKAFTELQKAEFVSLAADMWTSNSMDAYLGVTCHYITEESELHAVLLGVTNFPQGHAAEDIKEAMVVILSEWGLNGKVNCLVMENTSNMTSCAELLQLKHVPCFAHTLNLVVMKAMGHTEGLQDIRRRARRIVGLFQSNSAAKERLSNVQDQMGMQRMNLIQEVETRWNSTYLMLQRLHEQRESVGAVLASLNANITPLSSAEYDAIKHCLEVLAPFYHATTELSEEKWVCASIVIPMVRMIQHKLAEKCTINNNQLASVLGTNLQHCLHVQCGGVESVHVLALATLLDPRFKTIAFGNSQLAEQAERNLTAECASLCLSGSIQEDLPSSSTTGNSSQKLKMETTSVEETPAPFTSSSDKDSLWDLLESGVNEAQKVPNTTADAIFEVRRYLSDPYLPRTGDPLEFWRNYSAIYPHLFSLARKYLSMPVSSVPCDHIFSEAGDVVCQKRNRLSPSAVEKVLFLNNNL